MNTIKARLIINPVSGTRSKKGLDKAVEKILDPSKFEVDIKFTSPPGNAFELAAEAVDNNFDMVIAAGGDGTINQVANALSFSECLLGIIPFGSGNGLARSLGIPPDEVQALKIISQLNMIDCDRGVVNNIPFYCTFGVGFDAEVSHRFAAMKKRGKITYIRSAFREYFNYKPQNYQIVIDDIKYIHEAFIIAACNAPQYGNNAFISPHANLSDGLLDITIVHSDSTFHNMKMGMDLMTGTLDKNKRIDSLKGQKFKIIRNNEAPVHIDGEPLSMGKELVIECQPKALKVLAPIKSPEFRPYISPLRAILNDWKYNVIHTFRHL